MYTHRYVYVYAYTHTNIIAQPATRNILRQLHICTYMYIHIYVYTYINTYMHIHAYSNINIYQRTTHKTHTHDMYIHTYTKTTGNTPYATTMMYICIYIFTHTHHMYIHTCTKQRVTHKMH